MKARFVRRADKDYARLPASVRRTFEKQLGYLLLDLRHPSLRAKKYDESNNVWQASVNRNWRFYFTIMGDEYVVLSIIEHPK